LASLLKLAGLERGAESALVARVKRQPTFTKPQYEEFLSNLGFTEIEVRPMMSPALFNLTLFFVDLEHVLGSGRQKVSEAHENALYRFLRTVLAPLIADDRRLAAKYGGVTWFVSAKKPGSAQRTAQAKCPSCDAPITPPYACQCGQKYPTIKGVTLLSETYARLWPRFSATASG
jgi:hypothetical protein